MVADCAVSDDDERGRAAARAFDAGVVQWACATSSGGLRHLQPRVVPQATVVLDWFHMTPLLVIADVVTKFSAKHPVRPCGIHQDNRQKDESPD